MTYAEDPPMLQPHRDDVGFSLNHWSLQKLDSGPVAQLVEQLTFNQWVTGSNPVGLTTQSLKHPVSGIFLYLRSPYYAQ